MIYPERLLPQDNFRNIDTVDIKDLYLVRHTQCPDYFDELGLTQEALGIPGLTHLPDLSTNLLGIFIEEDAYINVINRALNVKWQRGDEIIIPQFERDFQHVNNRYLYYLNIGTILDIKIDFEKDSIKSFAVCKVNHSPVKANFWHFSINWLVSLEGDNKYWHELSEREKNQGWSKKRLVHSTREMLRKRGVVEKPNYSSIPNYIFT